MKKVEEKKKKVPQLRFPGFEGEWEEKRLGEVAVLNPACESLPEIFYYIDLESVEAGVLIKKKKINKSVAPSRAQRLLKKGDLLFQMVRPYQQNNLFFSFDGDYVASTGYAQLRTSEIPMFLYYVLHYSSFLRSVLSRCTGSNYPAINSEDLGGIDLFVPSRREQQKIASFLSAVDERIEKMEKKLGALKKYKKGVMQKIFSQEIRFKAEDGEEFGEWEEKRLGEVGKVIGGGTPSTVNVDYWGGDIDWFTPTEIKTKYLKHSKRKLSEAGLNHSSAELLPKGSILFTSRATIGDVAIATFECATNQGFQSMIVQRDNVNEFWYYWIINNKKNFIRRANGSTFLEISRSDVRKTKACVPAVEEQQKIADFLTAIDEKINLVESEVEKVKEWKRGLMQKMFV